MAPVLKPSISFPNRSLYLLRKNSANGLTSSTASRNGGNSMMVSQRRCSRSCLKVSLFTALPRSSFVASTNRTSASMSFVPPTRLNRCSCTTRSSIFCTSKDRLPISSRNRVPPFASSNTPTRALSAPVKAPFSCPRRVEAASCSFRVPQSKVTNGLLARLLFSCIIRAICSFPVPLSPRIITVIWMGANIFTSSITFVKASLVRAKIFSRLLAICSFPFHRAFRNSNSSPCISLFGK